MSSIVAMIAMAIAITLAGAGVAAERSIQEIQDCARKNLPETSARQELSLLIRDGSGAEQTIEAELFWKRGEEGRSKVLLRVSAPRPAAGPMHTALRRRSASMDASSASDSMMALTCAA